MRHVRVLQILLILLSNRQWCRAPAATSLSRRSSLRDLPPADRKRSASPTPARAHVARGGLDCVAGGTIEFEMGVGHVLLQATIQPFVLSVACAASEVEARLHIALRLCSCGPTLRAPRLPPIARRGMLGSVGVNRSLACTSTNACSSCTGFSSRTGGRSACSACARSYWCMPRT